MKFKCLHCESNKLQQIETDVTKVTEVVGFNKDLKEFIYGEVSTEGGDLACFSCGDCQEPVINKYGNMVKTVRQFFDYLNS